MITDKIKALFQFIEYLHSNIDNFNQYDEVINELHVLVKERQKVTPRKNFSDKLKYDEIQEQIKDKLKVIQENILHPIRTKANELNICDLNKTETLWNWNISEIHALKDNFSKDDLPEIFSHKNKYLDYRTETKGEAFFGLIPFFNDLDELLKQLFDFFKETEINEFEAFEAKPIKANNIIEMAEIEWLMQDNLYEYYFENPKQQQSILSDFQHEQVSKDVNGWLKWMTKNSDLAKKHFPDFMAKLEQRIRKSPPYQTANIIQKLPENFFNRKADINKLSSITKTKKIKEQIQLLELTLRMEFETEIEQQAVESVRDELEENLEYWKAELSALTPQQNKRPKPELTINQIALKYVYEGLQITRENGNEIAKQYGHNSGEKLFQRFTHYSSAANRKGKPQPCTPKKLKNKIELLESVIEHLPADKQRRIKDELGILKKIQETEYL